MIGWQALNLFFIASHLAIILFILFGWIYARKLHLAVMLLTLFSWLVLGMRYGFGYCFWTDWHWAVRSKLGYNQQSSSFVKFLLDSLTGWNHDAQLVDWITATVFIACLLLSIKAQVSK